MTKSADFLLTQKEIKKMEMYAERIYNTAVVHNKKKKNFLT